jgi:hypothetical protein
MDRYAAGFLSFPAEFDAVREMPDDFGLDYVRANGKVVLEYRLALALAYEAPDDPAEDARSLNALRRSVWQQLEVIRHNNWKVPT